MALPADAPPDVALVAQRFTETSKGVVAFHLHRVFEAHAGFSSRREDLVLDGVYVDGAIAKVRVRSYTIDGKPASTDAEADLERSYEHPNPAEAFALPFDPRYADAYQFRAAGPQKLAFTSAVRDAAHGNGTVTYEPSGDVTTYTYQPNVLPPHATFGEITDRRAEVLPGYWAVTRENQQYKGSYGPFAGAGSVQVDYSNFRRFQDVPTALHSL